MQNPILKKVAAGAVIGLMGVATLVGYEYLKLPAEASSPIQAIAVQRDASGSTQTSAAMRVFEIQQEGSSARFVIDEVLRGAPYTVVGTTNQVAGQIAVNPVQPGAAQIGTILVNARTLATDSSQRDRMLKNAILETEQHEYISFTPSSMSGLPTNAAIGQTYPVQITGELTIKNVTQNVTFDAKITPSTENRIEGTAQADIRYADWGIGIPEVPMVAGVADQVRLELTFVATA